MDLLLSDNASVGGVGDDDEMMGVASLDDDDDDSDDDEFSYTDATTTTTNGRSRMNIASAHPPLDPSSSSSSSSSIHTKPSNMPDFTSFDRDDDDSGTSPAARKRLLLSNALERDPHLDFSSGSAVASTDVNNSMGPLGTYTSYQPTL